MVEPIFDYQFRLILIGDSTVGKSSLLKYFTDGKFAEVSKCNECDYRKRKKRANEIAIQCAQNSIASSKLVTVTTASEKRKKKRRRKRKKKKLHNLC